MSFEPRTVTRSVDASTTDAIAYTPLLVKAPGQTAGTIDDTNVMAIDVVPTIADILGHRPAVGRRRLAGRRAGDQRPGGAEADLRLRGA